MCHRVGSSVSEMKLEKQLLTKQADRWVFPVMTFISYEGLSGSLDSRAILSISMKTGSHLPALGLARFGSRFSLFVRVTGWWEKLKKDAGFFSLSFVKERELHEEDLFPATAPAFPMQAMGLNPVPFASFGIAIALVCGGVSSFFCVFFSPLT